MLLRKTPVSSSLLAAAIGAVLPSLAFAQSDATAPGDLDRVVVTGTRTAVTVDESLAAVEVIDREQIERSQARSLPDLLRGRAGITVGNQGGLGKQTSVFLRGSESNHALVLVDGVRIGNANFDLAAFQDLPLEMIERIEIVRGPRSSLYGSDAIGGVIQVFTRRDRGGYAPRFHLGGGSHGLREIGGGFGGGGERGWFGIDMGHQSSDGIDACSGSSTLFRGCFAEEPDKDGYENNALSLRGGVTVNDKVEAQAFALRAAGRNEFDSYADAFFASPNVSNTLQQVLGGKLRVKPVEGFDLQLSVGRNDDESEDFRAGTTAYGYFHSTRDIATLQGDVAIAEGQLLTVGADWMRDVVSSDVDYVTTRRRNHAAFAQYQGSFGRHDVQLSARHDDNEQFGEHTTGSIAYGVDLAHGLRATASAGTAFKAPTFADLYYPPFFGMATANPDLRPETSTSYEVGLAQRRTRWHWAVNAYQTRIEDLITLDAFFVPQNINKARITGGELVAGTELAGWDVNGALSYVEPRDASGANRGLLLPRRARSSARIDIDRAFGDVRVGLSWIASGPRFDDPPNQNRLAGHATLDLRAEYALSPAWTLQTRASNLGDRDYEKVEFFNQPGREYSVMLRYLPRR
jgi:vitamin B12 transporter